MKSDFYDRKNEKKNVQTTFPDKKGRFARILLRLPALRSIGLEAEIECPVDAAPIDKIPDQHLKRILSGHNSPVSPQSSNGDGGFVFNNTDTQQHSIMPPPPTLTNRQGNLRFKILKLFFL